MREEHPIQEARIKLVAALGYARSGIEYAQDRLDKYRDYQAALSMDLPHQVRLLIGRAIRDIPSRESDSPLLDLEREIVYHSARVSNIEGLIAAHDAEHGNSEKGA